MAKLELAAAKANLDVAQNVFDARDFLLEEGAIPRRDVETARANLGASPGRIWHRGPALDFIQFSEPNCRRYHRGGRTRVRSRPKPRLRKSLSAIQKLDLP
jgi:hypothetical protein